MNRTQLTSLVVALACFGAVGVSASTLSSSVAADPSDALDPDYEVIPVAGDGLADLESAIAGDGGDLASGGSDGSASQSSDPGSSDQREENDDGGDGDESSDGTSGEGDADGGGAGNGQNAGGDGGGQPAPGEDRFGLVDLLTLLVLAALLIATVFLCYRYRDRFRALFATDDDDLPEDTPRPVPDGPPADDNLVFETWDELRSDLDVDRPETLTAQECADAAATAGFDRAEIEQLRLDFEAVRYGGQPVTEERRRRARTAQKRLGLNGESP